MTPAIATTKLAMTRGLVKSIPTVSVSVVVIVVLVVDLAVSTVVVVVVSCLGVVVV